MKLEKKYLKLALTNSLIMSILSLTIMSMLKGVVAGLTNWIIMGYGATVFISWFPAYYISYKHHWNEGELLSFKRLYLPILVTVFLLLTSFLYSSVAFGYNWLDYFYFNGTFNSEKVLTHLLYTIVIIALVCMIQFMAINSEHQIVLNAAMLNRYMSSESPSHSNSDDALQDDKQVSVPCRQPQTITLTGSTKDSVLTIDISQFIYAESNANYLNIIYYDGEVKRKNIRMTIKQLEEAMGDCPHVMRCHRAYVVNVANVSYMDGTTSKGEAHFAMTEETIPVSKTYLEAFSNLLKQG